MNDFDYEVMQRKRLVNQSRGTIKGKKKKFSVNMPSDYMTKRERAGMNGDLRVLTNEGETPNIPLPWKVFKQMAPNAQKGYIEGLQTKYGANLKVISEMLGVTDLTVSKKCKELGYTVPRGLKLREQAWDEFIAGPVQEEPAEAPVDTVVDSVAEPEDEKSLEEAWTNHVEEEALLAMFRALKGTGAKVTIEVTL